MRHSPPLAFYKLWAATSGVYLMAGRCPCCGGHACPVGLGTAVLVGVGLAGVVHGVGALRSEVKNKAAVDRSAKVATIDPGRTSGN